MGTFRPARALNARVAQLIVPDVDKIADDVRTGARLEAPAVKVWSDVGDALVRPTHHGDKIKPVPANLRFTLEVPEYDRRNSGAGTHEMARHPGDPNLTDGNFFNCRCVERYEPDGVSKTIRATPARAQGPRTTASVICDHELGVESDQGNSEDRGARFMAAGIHYAAQRLG